MQNLIEPRLGEVFHCATSTNGEFTCIQELKGRYFINFGGGYNQIFTIEDMNLHEKNTINLKHSQ